MLSRLCLPQEPQFISALGIPAEFTRAVDIVQLSDEQAPEAGQLNTGELAVFPIISGEEELGELSLFGGQKRISRSDSQTAGQLASEIGPVVKNVLLVEETRRLADTCGLTGLANRRFITERLEHEIKRAQRYGTPVSIALCDADHFKQVNDVYGHNTGDEVLRLIAKTIQKTIRTVDYAGRWGGEEFLVILPETASAGARVVGERLRASVELGCANVPSGPEKTTVSIGISSWSRGDDLEALVGRADECLYRAKGRGRNRVEI